MIPTVVPVADVTARWRPSNHDRPRTWDAVRAEMETHEPDRLAWIAAHYLHIPIQVGTDGRIWNGHHRVVAAMRTGAALSVFAHGSRARVSGSLTEEAINAAAFAVYAWRREARLPPRQVTHLTPTDWDLARAVLAAVAPFQDNTTAAGSSPREGATSPLLTGLETA